MRYILMNKDYFLNRLANGEDIADIGNEVAAMMNAAMAEHTARVEAEKAMKAEAERIANLENQKRDLAVKFVDLVRDYGMLVAPEAAATLENYTEEDLDQMIAAIDNMFALLTLTMMLGEAQTTQPATPKVTVHVPKSDDEVLSNFIKSLI